MIYFAWVRQRIGKTSEDLDIPAAVTTVAELLDWLEERAPAYRDALGRRDVLRVALDTELVSMTAPLGSAQEAAIFRRLPVARYDGHGSDR